MRVSIDPDIYLSIHYYFLLLLMCLWVCGQRRSVAERCGSVVHILTGYPFMNHAWRPITQCLVRPLLIVEPKPAADALARFGHRTIRFDIGEWRGASQPRALSEPCVRLSPHTAPVIQPPVPGSSGRT